MLFSWDHKDILDVCILFGGVSTEHSISISSARNIYEGMDKSKYNVTLVGITKEGKWYLQEPEIFKKKDLKKVRRTESEVAFLPGSKGRFLNIPNLQKSIKVDVVFPVLHGFSGEDGSIQGVLGYVDVPYVGNKILSSSICLDKDVTKRLLQGSNIPIPKFMSFRKGQRIDNSEIVYKLGLPIVIKPANLGSSIGITIVKKVLGINGAISRAFLYDKKIVVEEYVEGRELECAVLGNRKPEVSCIGEVIPNDEFYTYSAKYSAKSKAEIKIPADIQKQQETNIRRLAFKVFKILSCEGLARIDFFLKKNGDILVNEINTMPSFTDVSMYPKLWQESDIDCTDLIDKLIELAIKRYEEESDLKIS
jgi:D-alanine-D-alanine ligase